MDTQLIVETIANDSAPDVQFNISRKDGSNVDLTGAVVTLLITDPITGLRTNDADNECEILQNTPAIIKYSWTIGGTDIPDAGVYPAMIRIVYPSGKRESYKFRINADADE